MGNQLPEAVFFLGIGGIGMSGLARWYKRQGVLVSGYDKTETALTQALVGEGIPVFYTNEIPDSLHQASKIIYTPAVPLSHPVFAYAQEKGIPLLKRAAVLGEISQHQPCLAVAGTHGKTSVTALLAYLMQEGNAEPLAFVGGVLKNYQTNFLNGNGDWMVAEADEFDRSFLKLSPHSAVITAVDPDHLDIYGDAQTFEEGFRLFAEKVSAQGIILLHEKLRSFGNTITDRKILYYGQESNSDVVLSDIQHQGLFSTFTYIWGDICLPALKLNIPGRHNIHNAGAAITLALLAGVSPESIASSLARYTGVARRMDIRYHRTDLLYIDDYAHHPEEIRAVLSAVRELFPQAYLRVAFQPHLYSRTRDFCAGFAQSLSLADEVILLDIYPAREEPIPGISSQSIAAEMGTTPLRFCSKDALPSVLGAAHSGSMVIMTLGAGDIDTCVPLVEAFIQKAA